MPPDLFNVQPLDELPAVAPPRVALLCPCRSGVFILRREGEGGTRTLIIACIHCRRDLLTMPVDAAWLETLPLDSDAEPARPGWKWLGLIRTAEGWRPVATADSLGACWDALDSNHMRGARMVTQVDPKGT